MMNFCNLLCIHSEITTRLAPTNASEPTITHYSGLVQTKGTPSQQDRAREIMQNTVQFWTLPGGKNPF
jgi:hypothetical protein